MKKFLSFSIVLVAVACAAKPQTEAPIERPTPDASVTEDAGVHQDVADANVPLLDSSLDTPDTSVAPPVVQSCLDVCVSKHPIGVALSNAIDTCWQTSCRSACILGGDASGKVFGPDASVTDGGACKTPVLTPFESCSECTVANCCTPWDKAFTDPDGLALNECTNACWVKK